VAWSISRQVQPAPAVTVAVAGSNRSPRSKRVSMTIPPSARQNPQAWWPPPRTATGSPASRAKRTAAATSPVPAPRHSTAGRVRTRVLNSTRASS
jgi:hypothetical protein